MQVFTTIKSHNLPEGSIYPKMGEYQPPIYGGKDRQPDATVDLLQFVTRCKSHENRRAIEELRKLKNLPNTEQQQYKT